MEGGGGDGYVLSHIFFFFLTSRTHKKRGGGPLYNVDASMASCWKAGSDLCEGTLSLGESQAL